MKLRSSKRSIISPILRQLEILHPLFLDRNQGGKRMVALLREAGLKPEPHCEYFRPEEDDHIWIPSVAQKDWLIITSDKGIEADPINRASVLESGARVFLLEDGNNGASHWAASLIVSRSRIYEVVRTFKGPFFVDVKRETKLLVGNLRRPWSRPDSSPKDSIIIHEAAEAFESAMVRVNAADSVK